MNRGSLIHQEICQLKACKPYQPSLQIQALDNGLQFIIRDAPIAFGIDQTGVIELIHDEGQIHALHPGLVAPGFAQTMGSEVAPQPHLAADPSDKLPGLAPLHRALITRLH